jgi:flagellin-specific chaperone FliS
MRQTMARSLKQLQHNASGEQTQIKAASAKYQQEQYRNLSPVEVIRKLYDVAIVASKKNDKDLAQRAIKELVCGLNFDYPEVSVGLFKLYQYAKTSIRDGNMQEAIRVLEGLRSAWAQAFKLENQ